MLFPRARLVVSACLFLAWIGFLSYLVVQNQHMIVLSRPQFLLAPLCLIADVRDLDGHPAAEVSVDQVVWSEGQAVVPGEKLTVKFLADIGSKEGYDGPGKYILPLAPLKKEGGPVSELVPIPYPVGDFRIYKLTPETERQLEEIKLLRG